MSFTQYILQSCDGDLRYKVNFTGATNLNVGETWFIECGGIQSGCYQVEENTDERLEEYNSDECTFIEFDDCDGCEVDTNMALTNCNIYRGCPDDDRPFFTNDINWPTGAQYSGLQTILFEDPTTKNVKCFNKISTTITNPTSVIALTGFTNCTDCVEVCPKQDIVFLLDQSSSISASEFVFMKNGVNNIADLLEAEMDLGLVNMAAYKWSSCGVVQLISNLTSNHSTFTSSITSASPSGGGTYVNTALDDAYDQLFGAYSESSAEKTIIIITDGAISDYYGGCGSNSAINTATLIKTGLYSPAIDTPVKIIAVNIVSGVQQQLQYMASGSDNYYFANTFFTWQNSISDSVAGTGCEENVDYGGASNQTVWLTDGCCTEVPGIYVLLDSNYTPAANSGFQFMDTCYKFSTPVSDVFSSLVSYAVLTGDVVNNICTSTSTPDCRCSDVEAAYFENCCDSSQTITASYDTGVTGSPSIGDGFVLSGICWYYTGTPYLSEADHFIASFTSSICNTTDGTCPTCPSLTPTPTNTVTQTPSQTPTTSVTQTPSTTPTTSVTQTPTPTPTTSTPLFTTQKFSACTKFTNTDIVPCVYGTTAYTYNSVTYNVPLYIGNVCDLSPLMNSNYEITRDDIWVAALFHASYNGGCNAPFLTTINPSGYPPANCLTNVYFVSFFQWIDDTTVEFDLSTESSCQLPQILYSTGLTVSCTGTTESTGCTFHTELVNGDEHCLIYLGEVQTNEPIYVSSVNTEYSDCNSCQGLCNPQDIVVLMDQSGSVGSINWQDMQDGVIAIADDLETRMNLGEVRMSAIRWSNCSSTTQIVGLTSDHTIFTNAVDTAPFNGGGTYASRALSDAYDLLDVDNLTAEKSIILITDGGISDFTNQSCGIPSTSQLANQMKAGTYDSGVPIKIYTVNITNGNNLQLNSLSSGPQFQFSATDFDDFVDNVSGQIADNSCEENPFTGSSYNWYESTPCCTTFGLPDIVVALETGTTPTLTTDGFIYNGNCYTFNTLTGDTFSGSSVYTVLPTDIVTNACADSICSCSNLEKIFLRNCCDITDKIQVLYSGGTPTEGQGLEYDDKCYTYKGDTDGIDVGITTDTLTDDICLSGFCDCTVSGCGLQDIVVLVDQSGSIISDFDDIKTGVVNIADSLEGNMDSGEVKIGIIKWSSCGNVDEVIDLTDNHTNFVNAANNMSPDGGGTYVSYALEQAYNMLNGANSTLGAEKNILLITDGQIYDVTVPCSLASLSASQLTSQMTLGLFSNGVQVKIQTIGVGSGINVGQLETLASSPDLAYTADFDTFASDISNQIALTSCDENPVGDNPDLVYWNASGCCENLNLPDIVVSVSADTSVSGGYSFVFNSVCYTFTSLAGDSESGSTVDFIYETNIYTDGCTNPRCGDCNTDYKLYELENCCDETDTITIIYSGGTTTQGYGLEYDEKCYNYKGNPGTGTPVINTNTLLPNICTNGPLSGMCVTCGTPTPTPTNSVTPTITPSNTVTPTITTTNTPTPTPTLSSVACNSGTSDFIGGWLKESWDGTATNEYFQTRLIQVLPPDLPDPGNINNPINYDKIIIDRYSQGNVDQETELMALDGNNSGIITLDYFDSSLIYYSILGITYDSLQEQLEVDLGPLINSQLTSYVNGVSYGICIRSSSTSNTPTPTITPTVTPTITVSPTTTPSITTTPAQTLTPTPSVTPSAVTTEVWEAAACCDRSDTLLVEVPTPETKVFVFYDGTSLDEASATQASESIREWYDEKVSYGDLSGNNLYEGVVGAPSSNGENWLWWSSYPYLGSMTGGTLSTNEQIDEFGSDPSDVVEFSIANSGWCQNSSGECRPKSTEFNDSNTTYRRINRGQNITTGINDTRTNGVPFDHSTELNNTANSGPGTFNGGISDYIVILVVDEADGAAGLYHPRIQKSNLTVDGFSLYSSVSEAQWWQPSAGNQPSTRFEAEYESYLKVWRDIQLIGGRVNGLVYPVIDSSTARIPFPLHCLGAIEGETITNTEFQTKYGEPITSVGPENINCSLITTNNPYSTLTNTTSYQNLPTQYQNGAGLKNFGIQVDPTVYSFTSGVVGDSLDEFLDSTDLSEGYGFNNGGTCYYFTQETLGTPQLILKWNQILPDYCDDVSCICASATPSVTPTNTPTPTPSASNLPGCVSGQTSGDYVFVDCCGVTQRGSSLGVTFCVDTSAYYSGIVLTYNECVPSCDEGPLEIAFSATPNCGSLGSIFIDVQGGTKPYLIQNTSPGTVPDTSGNGPFTFDNLPAGTYVFNISDSTLPNSRLITQQIVIPDCFDVEIEALDVPCNDTTGSIIISGDSSNYPYTILLYQNSTLFQTVTTDINPYSFDSGIIPSSYYAVVTDGTGQEITTSTVNVSQSNNVDFDVLITGASPCNYYSNGYGAVTGLTGTPPYTFQWSNGGTTQIVDNLPPGNGSVIVTSSNGCTKLENFVVGNLSSLGVSSVTGTQPDCFNCNGSLTFTITGGTTPYSFSASTGELQSGGETFTLNNLCAGVHSIHVQDSGECNLTYPSTLTSTAGFSVVSVLSQNSNCGENGEITINIEGVTGIVTYSITGNTGYSESASSSSQTHTFDNLASDTYTIEVTSNSGCNYTTTKTIENENKFTIDVSQITGTTCGTNNGEVNIVVSSGSTSIQYPLSYNVKRISDGFTIYNNINSNSDTLNLTGLNSGSYEVSVTDNNGCVNLNYFTISESTGGVQAILYSTNCVSGNDGTATLEIVEGSAPFTITWSNGVTNQNYLSGLSGGTYSVTVVDSDGCTIQKQTTVVCDSEDVEDYVINTLCEQNFVTSSQGKRGFYEMLNEAFLDLNQPGNGCELTQAIFTGVLTISGGSYGIGQTLENEFYTGYTLNDVPSDNEWESVVNGLLSQFSGITYTTDILNNIFTIAGDCEGDVDPTSGAFVDLRIEIDLQVTCDGRAATPTPTPTATSTPVSPTQTPTLTQTPTITNSVTPTVTTTPSITTTPTVTQTPTPTLSVTPSVTVSPGLSPTPTPSITPTSTVTPTISVSVTPTNTTTPSITPTSTVTPSVTGTPGLSPTPTPSSTPPPLSCDLIVVGSGRELSCTLEISSSITSLDCNLVVSGSYVFVTPTPTPTPSTNS